MARGSGAVYARRGGGDKNENRDGLRRDLSKSSARVCFRAESEPNYGFM